MVWDLPVKVCGLEVAYTLLWSSIGNDNIDTVRAQDSVNFRKHCSCIRARSVTTKNWIERPLVNYRVKCGIAVLQLAHIHLLIDEWRVAFLVHLRHLLDNSERDIDICNVLVTIFVHFFRKACKTHQKLKSKEIVLTWITSANVENSVAWLHVLRDDIFEACVALIPVELLFVLLIAIFPVFLLSVLRHLNFF